MNAFNSPLELGMRMAFLLLSLYPRRADLQRLIYMDYASIYSADLGGPPSLHTPIPLRGTEYTSRRAIIEEGLYLMAMKSVVDVFAESDGIRYAAGEQAAALTGLMGGSYVNALRNRCDWVAREFGDISDAALARRFSEDGLRWGTELISSGLDRVST
jgi:hypothetical protein